MSAVALMQVNSRHRGNGMTRKRQLGFTLIELMIVITVLGIIVAIAYPSYTEQMRKSRRAEGMGELLELADRMERFYSDRGTYVGASLGTAATNIYPTTSAKGYYTLSIASQTATDFSVSAAPTSKGKQNKDKCGTFTMTAQGIKSVSNTAYLAECWK
jgi:type IV pilus assembly protein PilE